MYAPELYKLLNAMWSLTRKRVYKSPAKNTYGNHMPPDWYISIHDANSKLESYKADLYINICYGVFIHYLQATYDTCIDVVIMLCNVKSPI